MEELEIFPTRIYQGYDENLSEYRDNLLFRIAEHSVNHASNAVSNVGGFQSNPFLYDVPTFREFHDVLWNAISPFIDQIAINIGSLGNAPKLTLHNLWYNINYPGAYNIEHTHPHAIYSGVLWIKVPENSGNLVMSDPCKHIIYGTVPTDYGFVPEEGKIIVFPSHIPHRVEVNNSTENRISLSFNINMS